MARSGRIIEWIVAAGLAAAAFAISPFGVERLTGRADLPFRVNALSLVFTAFVAVLAAALLAQGKPRRIAFYALAVIFPFVLLGGVEAIALSIRLADRIAPLENPSLLARKTPWPGYLMSDARIYNDPSGTRLYRPWQGDGITINELGLRTAMPAPKAPGEWRIAVTGGSEVWGWRVLDADTVPAQLQDNLRRSGHGNVTVYNFGIEGATLRQELALLKLFRERYSIDQVLFFTGGNDVILTYAEATRGHAGPWAGNAMTFELIKVAVRLQAMAGEPSPQMLHWLDQEVLPQALAHSTLRAGVAAATTYCRDTNLRCDFALQPLLLQRKTPAGPEDGLVLAHERTYPRIGTLIKRMYRDAIATGPVGQVHDLSRIFDASSQPHFIDLIHQNEAGNRLSAEHLLPIAAARLPR